MEDDNKYIRFDWAAKRMLRDKANFGVFEGLITVLLNEPVHIIEILESESNQNDADDKFNRVDIKARDSKDEIILVEIQQARELYYLERVLYGVAKTITEHISLGDKYDKVRKVYSISILYFDLGQGADYLYHGQTSLVGVHTKDTLKINTRDKGMIQIKNYGKNNSKKYTKKVHFPESTKYTMVKPQAAEGTWWVTAWENRRLPAFLIAKRSQETSGGAPQRFLAFFVRAGLRMKVLSPVYYVYFTLIE